MSLTYPKIKMLLGEGHTIEVWFDKEDIITASIVRQVNPVSVVIPVGTLEFTFFTTGNAFSMFEDGTYFDQLSKRQAIDVYEYINGSDRYLGKFYLDEWENVNENVVKFTAFDLVGVADATQFEGYYWSSATTLSDIIYSILHPVDISYTIDVSLASDTFTGWIPPGTCREALQQICFAAGAMVVNADDDELQIVPTVLPILSPAAEGTIADSGKTDKQKIELLPLVTSIDLYSHDYSAGAVQETIFEDYLEVGEYTIIFNEPYYDITATGVGYDPIYITAEDGDYLCSEVTSEVTYIVIGGTFQYGSNSIYLHVYSAGTVTIKGYPWIDNKQSHLYEESGLDENVTRNDKIIKNATMVSSAIADDVLTRISNYYKQRYKQESNLFPCVYKTGDCIIIGSYFSKQILAILEKMDYDLTIGFIAKVKLIGVEYIS